MFKFATMNTTEQPIPKKSRFRWIGWVIASPFILFAVLAILLYLPPIQNFLVGKAATYASQATGMNISVGRIALSFPLDLIIKDVQATTSEKDTLLQVDYLKVDLQLLPLLKKRIELDGISLKGAVVDTRDKIPGVWAKGKLGEFFVESHGVIFNPETAVIDRISLKDTDLSIHLNDTTQQEETPSDTLYWKIILKKMDLENVAFQLQMPREELNLNVSTRHTALRNGLIDLHRESYSLQSFTLEETAFSYNSTLALTEVDAQLDSLYYCGKDIRARISRLDGKDQSGLELTEGRARLTADVHRINLPELTLKTTDSDLSMNALLDWDILDMNPHATMRTQLKAEIGKEDIVRMAGAVDSTFNLQYPDEDLLIDTQLEGNLRELRLQTLSARLTHSFDLQAEGTLMHLTDTLLRGGEIDLRAETMNMDFLTPLTGGSFAIPPATRLQGKFTMAGPDMEANLTLYQPESDAFIGTDSLLAVTPEDSTLTDKGFETKHAARIAARYNTSRQAYSADMTINDLDMHQYLPQDSIFGISAQLQIQGEGTDLFAPQTRLNAQGSISKLHYTSYLLSGYDLEATLKEQLLNASLRADNRAMNLQATLDGQLKPDDIAAHLQMEVGKLDWHAMKLMDVPFSTSHHFDVTFDTDLRKKYQLEASMTNTSVQAPKRQFKTKDLFIGFNTQADSTQAYLKAGDLDMDLQALGHIETLGAQTDTLIATLNRQWTTKTIDQEALKLLFPTMTLHITSGKDNPICNVLAMKGITYDQLHMDFQSSPEEGLNGKSSVYGMHTDSLMLDTLYLNVTHGLEGLDFQTGVISKARKGQEAFDIDLDGFIHNGSAQVMFQYLNAKKERGVYMGLNAELRRRGIRMKLIPETPTLVYRPFTLNKQNFIYLADRGRLFGNISLYDEQGTGLGFYANRQDSLANQDMTVELSRINLKEFKRIMPYLPEMEGWLGGEAHYVDTNGEVSISGDFRMEDFNYEGNALGDWEVSGVYLPETGNEHYVDGFIRHNGEEIAYVNGAYTSSEKEGDNLEADMSLTDFPLYVINPFVPDKFVEFSGKSSGMLSMEGNPARPTLNGEVKMDSVILALPDLSVKFRMDEKPVQMVDSKLSFNDFHIYTAGKSPFTINGTVNMANLERITTDLRMKATDYELMNAKKTRRAVTYGKIYVDVDATLRGAIDELKMRGNMNVLGKTDFTYILKDSPLAVSDRLGDMVTFVNFNDTVPVAEVEKQPVSLNGMDIAMTVHIDQAVQVHVDLTPDASNYMLVEGGGDLSFQYTPQGDMLLNGRYSLMSGELKYEIPIIPLKTFNIQDGSYIDWTGNPMNPQLNIKATEHIRASVSENKETPRMVGFDVGIALTERLENLGLAFTLESPEDASVQEQLNAMSPEERGKLAVTMLVTGMYMAEGNATGGFNVNNALNSFLQNQISNIAGKTLDVNLGMETTDNASGGKQTDYNFQFAKRFWNNRFRIVIGGKVSTGNTAQRDETFIDNVSIEYRLDNSGTRYVKLFHDKNYESILEGEVIETGIGIVLRKKMSELGELFIFKRKDDHENE